MKQKKNESDLSSRQLDRINDSFVQSMPESGIQVKKPKKKMTGNSEQNTFVKDIKNYQNEDQDNAEEKTDVLFNK